VRHYGFPTKIEGLATTLRAEDLASISVTKGIRYRLLGPKFQSYKVPLNTRPRRKPGESPLG
jgi:hypothetical protein